MKEKRLSNFDLMKIISMLFIILWHILMHGKVLQNTTGNLNIFLTIVMFFIRVHVNSFVLVTGYFQYKKEFKIFKLISLNNAMWFYKSIILIIFLYYGLVDVGLIEKIKVFLPINYNDYWFIHYYLLLYLSSPLLNIIIKNIDKKKHRLIIIMMFMILSVLSTITNQEGYNNFFGYSLGNFIMLYFIGSYISKYDINIVKKINKCLIFIILIIISVLSTLLIFKVNDIVTMNEYLLRIKNIIINTQYSYCTPTIILQSILYFYFFKSLKIKNKVISKISTLTFGIYLIHDNNYIRNYLYLNIFKLPLETIYTSEIILEILLYTIIIFISCAFIEFVRILLFKCLSKIFKYNKIKENFKLKMSTFV